MEVLVKRFSLSLLCLLALLLCIAPTASAAPRTPPKHAYPADIDWAAYVGNCTLSDGSNFCETLVNWLEENGGLPVFGLPIGPIVDREYGLDFPFERFRVEYHDNEPDGSPYFMQLGIMGEERLVQLGRIWQNEPRANPQPGCRYFAETGHNLCGVFQTYWTSHGREFFQKGVTFEESLALFGFPISEATPEVGADGVVRMTQWFQRARMEDHGANGVLLGLLNAEVRQAQASPPAAAPTFVNPAPPPAPPPAPAPEPAPTTEPAPAQPTGGRIGAVCRDGTRSSATGRGACSHHGGVDHWLYA
jgi:hypothetical protein